MSTDRDTLIRRTPATMTPEDLGAAVALGLFWPGDNVVVRAGERGILNYAISRVQRRLNSDLRTGMDRRTLRYASTFSHVGKIVDEWHIGEMYAPRARYRSFHDLAGCEIAITRLRYVTPADWARTAEACRRDVQQGLDYPESELLSYWLERAPGPLGWAFRPVARFFDRPTTDVCSGRVVEWDKASGSRDIIDELPRYWWPSRTLLDSRYHLVSLVRLTD